jgi:hypothetical protein
MLKIDVYCTRFKTNYSSITGGSSGNKCSNSGGAKEKQRQGETQFTTKTEVPSPLNANF